MQKYFIIFVDKIIYIKFMFIDLYLKILEEICLLNIVLNRFKIKTFKIFILSFKNFLQRISYKTQQ